MFDPHRLVIPKPYFEGILECRPDSGKLILAYVLLLLDFCIGYFLSISVGVLTLGICKELLLSSLGDFRTSNAVFILKSKFTDDLLY
mmetsp:Transcript_8086/g.1072  ORF Transcript_8086/g.1072 Transcript_8086/m.1072 type:complete len:87 (+) Transcript_8086:11-271(+)